MISEMKCFIKNYCRHVSFFAAILFSTYSAQAQNDTTRFETHVWGGFGYNMVDILHGHLSATTTWHTNEHFDLRGGFRWRSSKMLSPEVVATVKFPMGKGAILLENSYIYQAWLEYNMQEFNSVLTLGYGTPRWKVQIGTFNKFYSNMKTPYRNVDYIFEPLNFAYNAEVWVLRMTHRFNVGLRLGNVEDFVAERFYSPIFTIKWYYRVKDNWMITGNIRNHHSGIFDLNQNFFERTFQLGTYLSW